MCTLHTMHTAHWHEVNVQFDDVARANDESSQGQHGAEPVDEGPSQSDLDVDDSQCDCRQLKDQLHNNLTTVFLKMQGILHVSEMATQEIVDQFGEIFFLFRPLLRQVIGDVLQRHSSNASDSALDEVVKVVMDNNVFVSASAKGAELSSSKRRKSCFENNYPVVMPQQYIIQPDHTAVYVPVLHMMQALFKHTDVLDKIQEANSSSCDHYSSHRDGSYFQENTFLLMPGDLKIPVLLYIDDLEIANPLGTSRKIHKLCAVYWVFLIQSHEVADGTFNMRTMTSHDLNAQNVLCGDGTPECGVKADCVFRQSLRHFHPITGFPPDILHDLLEGIVPVELPLCLQEMIRLKYFTLDFLNTKICTFPYKGTDKSDKPKPIPKTFMAKKTIGGNAHENAALIPLLPFLIGSLVPEGDYAWEVLMDLKDIVELSLSPTFTEGTICYLQSKITDHRQVLSEVFPQFTLKAKHHYIEHYPELIRRFGPLVNLWTMRFEGKIAFLSGLFMVLKTLKMFSFHLQGDIST
ncbi:uncharacterized protein LOC121711457 isoform X1 [Alosa sapidissima]|uniref:uncharacterized protein LOC121711457 isoform X1 n=1 Tax=Alosa sapidissima TaxID=34773 RepID=UPI001C097B24|nr:uncharacterized protein LOC121711457 isoform X1 [Alosa sapidissima]